MDMPCLQPRRGPGADPGAEQGPTIIHRVDPGAHMHLLDNTLRDGEQTPGVAFNRTQKTRIIEMLCAAGVTDAEVGYPAVSDEERRTISCIARESFPIRLHALCRLSKRDIDSALECGVSHLTVFVPTGRSARETLFGSLQLEDGIDTIRELVGYAVSQGAIVKFSCEHASQHWRGDPGLFSAYVAAYETGASTVSIPDTAGILLTDEVPSLLQKMRQYVTCDISVHFHNDLGLATANTVAAAVAGATELQVCVNGLGERAGNASLEEVAYLMCHRYGRLPPLDFIALKRLSDYVYDASGLQPGFNKPFWGKNAFAHESGIHVAAIEAGEEHLYSALPARMIGREISILLGKHAGLANIRMFARKHGITASDAQLKSALSLVKDIVEQNGALCPRDSESRLLDFFGRTDPTT
jgi:isopropylmalate/homocitrate/citramalate synthase